MTIEETAARMRDFAAAMVAVDWGSTVAADMVALCDALTAEQERVCALYQFLVEWDQQDSLRDPDYRDQLQERYTAWIGVARAALAATEGGGA